MHWYRIWSNGESTCWERRGVTCRVLRGQAIRAVAIENLAAGDIVLGHEGGWRPGEPEYLLPVERIETACCEFEPQGNTSEEPKAGAA